MSKKRQELSPDIVLKNYWNNNEQFADLINAVLFDGAQIIKADELEDMDIEESTVFEHKKYAESVKAFRDNIKIRKKSTVFEVEFVLLGLESQEHIHFAMPMRVMGYDYGVYKKQYDSSWCNKYKIGYIVADGTGVSRNVWEADSLIKISFSSLIKGRMPGKQFYPALL